MKLMGRDRFIDFDLEVFPVGFRPEIGVIVGITQGLRMYCSERTPFYEPQTKVHPYLHSILRHLIEAGKTERATLLAEQYSHLPHFSHSLELLLHETIEEELSGQKGKEKLKKFEQLEQVVAFLRGFSDFAKTVVGVARKTDASKWADLFSVVGDPLALFESCLGGQFHVAGSCLIILRSLTSETIAAQAALKLLQIALDNNEFDVFLRKVCLLIE